MTREEKLQQFAEQTTKGLYLDRHNLIQMVKEGAEWADQHPNWISVDDELPPRSEGSFIFSKTVLVCNKVGYIDTAWYNFKLNRWEWLNDITHWTPLPSAPVKGGAQ